VQWSGIDDGERRGRRAEAMTGLPGALLRRADFDIISLLII
jgi:hypothetical protein